MAAPRDRRSITKTQAGEPVRREIIARPGGAGLAAILLALASGSVFATLAFLDLPRIEHRVAGFWNWTDGSIRTIEAAKTDPSIVLARLTAERDALRRRIAAADEDIATGSIGQVPKPGSAAASAGPDSRLSPQAAFGADIGPSQTIRGLRQVWATVRDRLAGEARSLQPLIAIRETKGGHELRLVIGPMADAASVARICAQLGDFAAGCAPVSFDGQRLSPP